MLKMRSLYLVQSIPVKYQQRGMATTIIAIGIEFCLVTTPDVLRHFTLILFVLPNGGVVGKKYVNER